MRRDFKIFFFLLRSRELQCKALRGGRLARPFITPHSVCPRLIRLIRDDDDDDDEENVIVIKI
jgi:hypothetical protein